MAVEEWTDADTTAAGFVTDEVTGRPIAGASVHTDLRATRQTNLHGGYVINTDPASSVIHVWADAPRYEESDHKSVVPRPGYRRRVDLPLRRAVVGFGSPIPGYLLDVAEYWSVNGFAVRASHFMLSERRGDREEGSLWEYHPREGRWALCFENAGNLPLTWCGESLHYAKMWVHNDADDGKRWGQVAAVGPRGLGENIRWLPTPFPRGLACDGKRLWYVSNSFLKPDVKIYALDRETLDREARDRGGPGIVGQAASADPYLIGIAFGPDASGQDRLWISSYDGCDEPFREPRGLVYVIDPEALLRTGVLPEVRIEDGVPVVDDREVVVDAFEGFWCQLSYDEITQTLWGLDPLTKRICQLCIDPARPTPPSEPTPEDKPAPANEPGTGD